jgi:hypothetical protein
MIHIIYEDQAKDSLFISSGLVNMSSNIFLAGSKFVAFGFAQGKGDEDMTPSDMTIDYKVS